MECVQKVEDLRNLSSNQFVHTDGQIEFVNSKFYFHGTGNLVYVNSPANVKTQFVSTVVHFYGNNNLLFIQAGNSKYTFDLHMFHNSACHIGANNYMNPYGEVLRLRCAEEKNIFIGDDGLFATNVEVTVSDSHLIFDSTNLQRVNYAKSIYIGDHVWLGRMSAILKGAQIGSGAIIGTRSITTKRIPSNTSWAGSPAKQRGSKMFFVGYNASPYQKADIELHQTYNSDRWIYANDEKTLSFDQIETDISLLETASDKANYFVELNKNKSKNRFFIE